MEYRAISSTYAVDLNKEVNAALKDGWKLEGGLQLTGTREAPLFAQLIVRNPNGGARRTTRRR